MKVLVLGGTRFFGREAALGLARKGHEVTVLTRGRRAVPPELRHFEADRDEAGALRKAAAMGFDAVLDNIAFHGAHVRAAVEAFGGSIGHYVLTSSAAVYFGAGRPPFEEGLRLDAEATGKSLERRQGREYTLGKIEAEETLRSQDRLAFTIVRPPVVVGPRDPTLRIHFFVQRVLDGGPILLTDGGRHCFHLADSRDLAEAYRLILEAGPSATGKAYNLCQRDLLDLQELAGCVARSLGRELRAVSIPAELLRRMAPSFPDPLGATFQFAGLVAPPCRAMRELGFRPRPVLEAVAEAALWHAAHTREDSPGYGERRRELELARRFKEAVRTLRYVDP